MRSLKLSRLIARDSARPTFKQRASALRATAARVIGAPKADSPQDLIARAAQHPGMMAFPPDQPTSLVSVKFGIRLEAKRILGLALDEFARLYAAQVADAGEAARQRIAERLRRELRIEAIEVAAADAGPDVEAGIGLDLHTMTGGVIHCDGMVSFCDAGGAVHNKPVADWIGFTAARLFTAARKEMARQVNDPLLNDAERDALARSLRRDLRFDALRILVTRWHDAFIQTEALSREDASAPIPELHEYPAGPASVYLQQAIEAHREAVQTLLHDPIDDEERRQAALVRIRALADAVREIPARSHADLRAKTTYLWPDVSAGEKISEDLSETLASLWNDIDRLGREPDEATGDHLSDPVFAAIAASRAAEAEMGAWQAQTGKRRRGMSPALFAEENRLAEIQTRARDTALSTVPTTHAGRLAFVEYVRFVRGLYGVMDDGTPSPDDAHIWRQTHGSLIAALSHPVAGMAAPDFAAMTLTQIGRLYEAVTSIWRHVSAETQSPCFWDEKDENYNAAGRVLDTEADRLADLLSAINREAKLRSPQSDKDRDERLNVLTLYEMLCEGRIANRELQAEISAAWKA